MHNKNIKKYIYVILALALIGFTDAMYLTVSHYTGAELSCNISSGCESVTNSQYSTIFGIPVALFGAIFYLATALFSVAYLDRGKKIILTVIKSMAPFAFMFSAWFIYVQLFVLHEICQYCMLSAGLSITIFFITLALREKQKEARR